MTANGNRPRLDPITFEVLRHRLDEIVAEAYHTIGRVSGSPVVYEAGDHQEAICTAGGELVAVGAGALHWIRSIAEGVKHVSTNFAENPGFAEGDQFIVNDSYIASVHASDLQLLAPIFWEGRLIAWAGSASHQPDTGGVTPGGHHVSATEVYAEGFQTPGLKLVEGGTIRRDVEATLANMIREPKLGLLDVRAKIASNNVMRERLLALVARYGVETVLALFDQILDYSESRLRGRLGEIEDGEWHATAHIEAIAEPHLSARLRLVKHDDTLTFDFTGTSPQSAGAENIGVPGVKSGAMCAVLMGLCHDLPWNEGLFRPIEFVLPEGSVVNPIRPAPVSSNVPSGGLTLVTASAQTAVAKMLLSTDAHREDAAGVVGATFNFPVFAGAGPDGSAFATLILDGLAGGAGALVDDDGDSSGHCAWGAKTKIANVETTELLYPLRYLWRREVADSAGAGRFRGGVGVSVGITPRDVPGLACITVGVGTESRGSLGLAGGYPGSHAPVAVLRGEAGTREPLAPKGVAMMAAGDVLEMQVSSGGGGFGDPLERDPALVAADVVAQVVSPEMAYAVYGVGVADNGAFDGAATAARRDELRSERLAKASTVDDADGRLVFDEPIGHGEPLGLAPDAPLFALRHSCDATSGALLDVEVVVTEFAG